MIIYRLLQGLNPDDYCLISRYNYSAGANHDNYSSKLPGRYYQLSDKLQIPRGHSFSLIQWANIPLGLLSYTKQIADILRREECEAVIACTDDLLHLPAGYWASRMVDIPFYPYLFDDYSTKWLEPPAQSFAHRIEPFLLKKAAGIISPNELLRDDLRQRYGVEATVIHNTCDLSAYPIARNETPRRSNDEVRIVYTGAIYDAHYDAFQNLVSAINLLGKKNIKLHLYSTKPRRELEEKGICGPVVYHEHEPLFAIPHIQQQADLLFLPLAFASPYPEIIRTSQPVKMGEYLAARQPILVHAPPDSFIARYFRDNKCGLVIDQREPATLAQAIERLLTDVDLRQQLLMNARKRAESDFSISVARAIFAKLMQLDLPDHQSNE